MIEIPLDDVPLSKNSNIKNFEKVLNSRCIPFLILAEENKTNSEFLM